ncbi:MAG: HAMP domain-containing histidine kinase [Actinobacteria bacterium]|nr:HAMP domain-containing histidine kinase [Actinomycetota bacterium]
MIRGIRLRLALALLGVVAGALTVAYLIVVPTLETRLVDAKIDQLEQNAVTIADCIEVTEFPWQDCADTGSAALNARVVIYGLFQREPPALQILADSRPASSQDVEHDTVAELAATTGKPQRDTVSRRGDEFAEAALPVTADGPVVLLSSSLADPLSSVQVVERRLLAAGLIGLLVALLLGYAGASLHARRIRRLERAAERIASGRFDEPVVDGGNDEVGELAAAFERMRRRLENLDRARREFIANASHELRTPLFSLGGFLELMADEELDEPTRQEFLVTMGEQVARLTKLATDLLDLSRMDAGRMRVEADQVDLGGIAQVLVEEFRAVAEQRRHDLALVVEEHPLAAGDEVRILQIGRALVGNALVHTPTETRVVVRASSEGGRALLSVEDDGPGIPSEHVAHVFDRFYRAEGDVASGSGLGLAIARELALLMGGDVELDSAPGHTTVSLSLPVGSARVLEPPTPASVLS